MATATKTPKASSNGAGPPATAGAAALAGTRAAGRAVVLAASKAKAPLIAGGAAAAGLAGGLALTSERKRKRRGPSFDLDSATAAAKRVGSYGQQIAEVAEALEQTRKRHR